MGGVHKNSAVVEYANDKNELLKSYCRLCFVVNWPDLIVIPVTFSVWLIKFDEILNSLRN